MPIEAVEMGQIVCMVAFRTDANNPQMVAQGPAVLEFVDDETGDLFPVEVLKMPDAPIILPGTQPMTMRGK